MRIFLYHSICFSARANIPVRSKVPEKLMEAGLDADMSTSVKLYMKRYGSVMTGTDFAGRLVSFNGAPLNSIAYTAIGRIVSNDYRQEVVQNAKVARTPFFMPVMVDGRW